MSEADTQRTHRDDGPTPEDIQDVADRLREFGGFDDIADWLDRGADRLRGNAR